MRAPVGQTSIAATIFMTAALLSCGDATQPEMGLVRVTVGELNNAAEILLQAGETYSFEVTANVAAGIITYEIDVMELAGWTLVAEATAAEPNTYGLPEGAFGNGGSGAVLIVAGANTVIVEVVFAGEVPAADVNLGLTPTQAPGILNVTVVPGAPVPLDAPMTCYVEAINHNGPQDGLEVRVWISDSGGAPMIPMEMLGWNALMGTYDGAFLAPAVADAGAAFFVEVTEVANAATNLFSIPFPVGP